MTARNIKTMINIINLHIWHCQYVLVFALKWTQYITSNLINVTSNLMSASSIVCHVRNMCLFKIDSRNQIISNKNNIAIYLNNILLNDEKFVVKNKDYNLLDRSLEILEEPHSNPPQWQSFQSSKNRQENQW